MKRLPEFGNVIVTGPASRSNTADEYRVAVHADDELLVDLSRRAVIEELPGTAGALVHAPGSEVVPPVSSTAAARLDFCSIQTRCPGRCTTLNGQGVQRGRPGKVEQVH